MTLAANRRLFRQTLTIARRDFTATVFTPLFLLFLLSPLVMLSFATIGALGGSTLARGPVSKDRIVTIAGGGDARALEIADKRLRAVFRPDEGPPALQILAPSGTGRDQAHRAFNARDYDASSVMYGPLDRPVILYGPQGQRTADYLATLAETALRDRVSGAAKTLSTPTKTPLARQTASRGGHGQAAFIAVTGIFFLTLFLSGQAVGTMAEERGNKVIEILAAAVPLEAVFLGKLIGMFGVAVLFVVFWATMIGEVSVILPSGAAAALVQIAPAIGTPLFVLLFCAYFTMAYMLLGAVFLSVGAQASTMREIQMLSLPITIVQMVMFGLASSAASNPGSTTALIAEVFPLSSPFAMAAHAANAPDLWPHLAALAWQLLWVGLTIAIGARAFRRGVLKSGGGPRRGTTLPDPT